MKNKAKWLMILLLIGGSFSHDVWSDTTYTIEATYDLKLAADLNPGDHGIEVSSPKSWQKVQVDVRTTANVHFRQALCSHTGSFLLYRAFVTANNSDLEHSGVNATVYNKGFAGIITCSTSHHTDGPHFIRNNAVTAGYIIFNPGQAPFKKILRPISVQVTLTLEGDLKLSDIKRVKTPGIPTLYPSDFVNRAISPSHHCDNNSSSTYCDDLGGVMSIPDVNATDVVIQAHRGVWGKNNQENTIGAFQAALDDGHLLLESDIMPIDVTNHTNPSDISTFGAPGGLAAFHDYVLDRLTDSSDSNKYIYNSSRSYLSGLNLKEPRSETVGTEKILFFDDLMEFAHANDRVVCVDMKSLESKGKDAQCTQLCDFQTQDRKNISLFHNIKKAIDITRGLNPSYLKNLAIKTYASYDVLRDELVNNYGIDVSDFDQVLWAPMIAANPQWEGTGGNYDPTKIQKWLDDWFAHNETVLYYETNFFNDYDQKTSVMLPIGAFCSNTSSGQECYNVIEYIYRMSGRRAGIFSEEPVGGKGVVNRWGKFKIKNPVSDRRGDHLWLLKQPFFKHAVITTERADQWDQLND